MVGLSDRLVRVCFPCSAADRNLLSFLVVDSEPNQRFFGLLVTLSSRNSASSGEFR